MSVDLRPRIVLHFAAGAVVILVDPTSPLAGTVDLPLLGVTPYSLDFGQLPIVNAVLHLPAYGDYPIPVDIIGGTGAGMVDLPLVGTTPYEVVLGPPSLTPDQMFSVGGLLTSSWVLPVLLIGGVLLLAWRR